MKRVLFILVFASVVFFSVNGQENSLSWEGTWILNRHIHQVLLRGNVAGLRYKPGPVIVGITHIEFITHDIAKLYSLFDDVETEHAAFYESEEKNISTTLFFDVKDVGKIKIYLQEIEENVYIYSFTYSTGDAIKILGQPNDFVFDNEIGIMKKLNEDE